LHPKKGDEIGIKMDEMDETARSSGIKTGKV